ncbi:hypothetical protein L7F22_041273 [Adiantum nelumboides]|nr:hypothetical protein [Adiantum nelumboides]
MEPPPPAQPIARTVAGTSATDQESSQQELLQQITNQLESLSINLVQGVRAPQSGTDCNRQEGQRQTREYVCYNCGEVGHGMYFCPHPRRYQGNGNHRRAPRQQVTPPRARPPNGQQNAPVAPPIQILRPPPPPPQTPAEIPPLPSGGEDRAVSVIRPKDHLDLAIPPSTYVKETMDKDGKYKLALAIFGASTNWHIDVEHCYLFVGTLRVRDKQTFLEKMEKRSWPWKKKTSEKSLTSTDPEAAEKLRRLNVKLLAADDLAKQHATVAEEAVSGWEKTKSEYMLMKYQLDTALEQKQAAEVRVFHLNGTLKDCMQQLRRAREEQEQAVHEAIVKRSREWDKLRLDLEERLAQMEVQVMESENQKSHLYKAAQEQAEAVAELGRIHSVEEVEIKKLQSQVQTLEKENTSLKYEIVVSNKELGIRNQEREMNHRSLEMAEQQHIESSKRIAKLENECQRLRALVRKKLPGPGALLQMKLEAGTEAERGDTWNKRRASGRAPGSPKAALHAGIPQKSPKIASMGNGFHSLDSSPAKEHSQGAMSDDGYDDNQSATDSWTSSLSQRERASPRRPNNVPLGEGFEKLNSTVNFLEIERLVSLPSEKLGGKSIVKASSVSEELLTKDVEHQAAIKLSPEASRATQVLRGDAACGRRSSHLREGSQIENSMPELGTLMLKITRIIEDLASKIIGDLGECQSGDDVCGHNNVQYKPKLQLSELEASLKKFNAAGNAFLYGKAELVLFVTALYSVLNQLNTFPKAYKPLNSRMKWRPEGRQIAEQEVISDVGSPFSSSSTSDRSDSSKKPQVEKGASREESTGIATMEHVITELQREKLELANKLEKERGKLDRMKEQLCDSEQLVVSLRARLASAELSGIVAEKSLSSITAVNSQLEVRLQDSQLELGRLREKVRELESRYEQEKRRNQELQIKTDIQRTAASGLHNDLETSNKEQEIADATEKLAECQRTILVLGQQLKDIVSTSDGKETVTYLNQVLDNAAKDGLSNHGIHIPTLQKGSSDLEACHIFRVATDELTDSPRSAKSDSEKQTFDPWDEVSYKTKHSTRSHNDADMQIVPYVTKPASKKKSNLHSFPTSPMSKFLNLEPSATPRKQANSISKFFSRHRSPS